MSSRRRSFGRILLLAILVVIALLLLELGRLLPGSWPGGGGDGGSRSFPTGSKPDPTTLVPSTAPPPPPKRTEEPGTIRVVVRRADGAPVEGGSVIIGGPRGGQSTPLIEGEARLHNEGATLDDWTVALVDGTRLAHGRAPERGGGVLIVTVPGSLLSTSAQPNASTAEPTVRVTDAEGHPLAGATVTSIGRKGERQAESGPDGAAHVPGAEGVERYCVSAAGFGEACAYARLKAGDSLVIQLSPIRERRTTFVDPATGAKLRARSLTLFGRSGVGKRLEREEGTFDRFDASMPEDVARESTLEIDVEGRPPMRVPIASMGAETAVPAGRSRAIRLLDERGEPVPGAVVTARFAGASTAESGSIGPVETTTKTGADGQAIVSIPLDRDTDLVIDSPEFTPEGLRLPGNALADPTPLDVRATRGVDCVVAVRDEQGAALGEADVRVLFAAGRATARRSARTDALGEAVLHAIPSGRVEVLVHRSGFAWASATASTPTGPHRFAIVLRPGKRMTLVVEDPSGAPVPRVTVRSVPRSTGGVDTATDAIDPDQTLPWETDANGVLISEDLPDREVDLYLSKVGFEEQVLVRVRPGPSSWFATLVPLKAR